ncbi:MAG: ABC transporter permease, partial [Bacteroidota bacterium]
LKNKVFAAINLIGLAAAFATSVVLLLVIQEQLSYDKFHEHTESLYRVYLQKSQTDADEGAFEYDIAQATPLRKALFDNVDEITHISRYDDDEVLIEYNGKNIESDVEFVDSDFFEMFSFPVVHGRQKELLSGLDEVVLSETRAEAVFGKEDPIGKSISLKFYDQWRSFRVVAVIEDEPHNSTIGVNVLVNFKVHPEYASTKEAWDAQFHKVYVQLAPKANRNLVAQKLRDFAQKQFAAQIATLKRLGAVPDKVDGFYTVKFQPLSDIHFNTTFSSGNPKSFLYLIGAISIFVLVVAGINFINLSIANLINRAREVGIRKIMGAYKRQLFIQFSMEALLITLFAFVVSLLLLLVMIPQVNTLFKSELTFSSLFEPTYLFYISLIMGLMALLAGGYPAWMMYQKQTVEVVKGKVLQSRKGIWNLKNSLLVLQFTLSALLIGGTLTVQQQIQFLHNKPLGFNKEEVITIPIGREIEGWKALERLKALTASNPDIIQVSASANNMGIGKDFSQMQYQIEMDYKDDKILTNYMSVGPAYLEVIGAEVLAGRFFSTKYPTDTSQAIVVNASFAKALKEKDPIGIRLVPDSTKGEVQIIGVVKDFHFHSLRAPVEPLIMRVDRSELMEYLFVKINGQNTTKAMKALEANWKEIAPASIFQGSFINENLQRYYQREQRLAKMFVMAALVIITISCMGLFAMTLLMVNRRTKEIGIRKVLGASVTQLTYLLNSSFVKLMGIALLIAYPLIYFTMTAWLENFTYRTT